MNLFESIEPSQQVIARLTGAHSEGCRLGLHLRSAREFASTLRLDSAIAAAASDGFKYPSAASGSPMTL